MKSCTLGDQHSKWADVVAKVTKANTKAATVDIENSTMAQVFGPHISGKMEGKARDVWGSLHSTDNGRTFVKYPGGRNNTPEMVLAVQEVDDGYSLILGTGEVYTFLNGSPVSEKTMAGNTVTVDAMEEINERVAEYTQGIVATLDSYEASSLFNSGGTMKKTDAHIEIVNKVWNDPKAAMELFNEFVAVQELDTEYKNSMETLLSTIIGSNSEIMNEFKVFVDRTAETNGGFAQVVKGDSEIVMNINTKSGAVNGEMSAVEVYMHELVHMSVEAARAHESGKMVGTILELSRLHGKARKSVTWQDLVVDGDNKAAQAMWSKMFDSDAGVSEFLALGLTNPKMMGLLKGMNAGTRVSKEGDSMWSKLTNILVNLLEEFRALVSSRGIAGDDRLKWLAANMWEHNKYAGSKEAGITRQIAQYATKGKSYVDDKIRRSVVGSAKYGSAGWIMLEESMSKDNYIRQAMTVTRGMATLANPYASLDKRAAMGKVMTEMSEAMDGGNDWLGLGGILAPEGSFRSIIEYLRKDDEATTRLERLGIANQKIDSIRTETQTAVGREIKIAIGEDVDEKGQIALSKVLVELDMQSLGADYSSEEILELLTDPDKIEVAIQKEHATIDKLLWNKKLRNYVKSQSMGLGHYLATGISGKAVQRTASDILYMTNTDHMSTGISLPEADVRDKARNTIDRLATLEGLKRVNPKYKERVVKAIDGRTEALETVIGMHKVYTAHIVKYAVDNQLVAPKKGEIKDTKDAGLISKVGYTTDEAKLKMKRKGYKYVGEAGVKGMGLYVSSTGGLEGFTKQAVAKINEGKRLHNIVGIMNESSMVDEAKLPDDASSYTKEELKAAKAEVKRRNEKIAEKIKEAEESLVEVTRAAALEEHSAMLESVMMPEMDGYIPMYGRLVGITNFGVSVDKDLYESSLRQDNKVPILLGKMVTEVGEKENAKRLNDEIYEDIMKGMREYDRGNKYDNRHDYIEIGVDAANKGLTARRFGEELYEGMPDGMRKKINSLPDGKKFIAVRRDLARMYFGARSPSVLDAGIPFTQGETMRSVLEDTRYGDALLRVMRMSGDIAKEVVSMQKVSIVLKTPVVLRDNIISNFMYSVALGQWPWEVAKQQAEMYSATKKYLDVKRNLEILEIDLRIKSGKMTNELLKGTKINVRSMRRELKANPVHPLMEAGMFTAIVEDIDDNDLVSNNKIESMIKGNKYASTVVDNTPTVVKDGLNILFMTDKTSAFKIMMMGTQFSDFVARANRYHYLLGTGVQHDKAIKMVLDEFTNYNRWYSEVLEWLNVFGVVWFTKYFFGSNKSGLEKLKESPTAMITMATMLDAPNPSDANFFEKNYGYSIKGPMDTYLDGTLEHLVPPSTLEILGIID